MRKHQVRIRAKAVGELAHQRRGEEFSPQASTLVPQPEKKTNSQEFVFFATMCSACAERDVHFVRDVCFASDVRFARKDAEHITSLCDHREQYITMVKP